MFGVICQVQIKGCLFLLTRGVGSFEKKFSFEQYNQNICYFRVTYFNSSASPDTLVCKMRQLAWPAQHSCCRLQPPTPPTATTVPGHFGSEFSSSSRVKIGSSSHCFVPCPPTHPPSSACGELSPWRVGRVELFCGDLVEVSCRCNLAVASCQRRADYIELAAPSCSKPTCMIPRFSALH